MWCKTMSSHLDTIPYQCVIYLKGGGHVTQAKFQDSFMHEEVLANVYQRVKFEARVLYRC